MWSAKERRVVDDRVFLLGLDWLYREAVKEHERSELLQRARDLSAILRVSPASGPVEGYYTEDARLTEYFRLMRALQEVSESARSRVEHEASYQRLHAVTSSPLYGTPSDNPSLFPPGRDALSKAMLKEPPLRWSIDHLVDLAHEISLRDDEISLVGLAARAKDAVVLAALRESVVLYAEVAVAAARRPPKPKYIWDVDESLRRQAVRFVETFNELFRDELPAPKPKNARQFWDASKENDILGRCVRVGMDDGVVPHRHYHWAICRADDGQSRVHGFWDVELWTTTRFTESLPSGRRCPSA